MREVLWGADSSPPKFFFLARVVVLVVVLFVCFLSVGPFPSASQGSATHVFLVLNEPL